MEEAEGKQPGMEDSRTNHQEDEAGTPDQKEVSVALTDDDENNSPSDETIDRASNQIEETPESGKESATYISQTTFEGFAKAGKDLIGHQEIHHDDRSQVTTHGKTIILSGNSKLTLFESDDENGKFIKDTLLKDPTQPLASDNSLKPEQLEPYQAIYSTEYSEVFAKQRILVVSCLHKPAVKSAVLGILDTFGEEYDKRSLSKNSEYTEGNFGGINIYNLSANSIKIGKNRKVVIQAYFNTMDVMRSSNVFDPEPENLRALKKTLIHKDFYLICYFSGQDWHRKIADQRIDDEIPHWHIPFVEYKLKDHFSDPNEYRHILTELEVQREQGKWSGNEVDFYREISLLLAQGKDRLRQEIEKRKQKKQVVRHPEDPANKQHRDSPKSIIEEHPLHKYVSYVGSRFRGLHFEEFDRLIRLLVPEPDDEHLTKKQRKKRGKTPMELWNEDPDGVLDRCGLALIKNSDGQTEMTFRDLETEKEVQTLMSGGYPAFSIVNVRHLFYSGVLLFPATSEHLESSLLQLFASMAAQDPGTLGKQMINDLFRYSLDQEGQFNTHEIGTLSKMVIQYQLCNLLQAMLSEEDTRLNEEIDRFLHHTLRTHQEDLIFLLRFLESSTRFDERGWIISLIKHENKIIQREAYLLFLRIAEKKPYRVYDYLHRLYDEFSAITESEFETLANNHPFLVHFLFHYSWRTLGDLDESDYGLHPPVYPLFAHLNDESVSRGRVQMLVRWILHSKIELAFITIHKPDVIKQNRLDEDDPQHLLRSARELSIVSDTELMDDPENCSIDDLHEFIHKCVDKMLSRQFKTIRADLVEEWGRVIQGVKESEKQIELYRTLLQTLVEEMGDCVFWEFSNAWEKRKQHYLEEANQLAVTKLKERKTLMLKRKFLKRFINNIRDLRKTSTKKLPQ